MLANHAQRYARRLHQVRNCPSSWLRPWNLYLGPVRGDITKGLFSPEESLKSLNSPESQTLEENVQNLLNSWESLEMNFLKRPLSKRPLFRTRFRSFRDPSKIVGNSWETNLCPVLVLGSIVFSLWGCQSPAQYRIKIVHPWVQIFYPVLGLGCGGRPSKGFQTPVLYWRSSVCEFLSKPQNNQVCWGVPA